MCVVSKSVVFMFKNISFVFVKFIILRTAIITPSMRGSNGV